MQILVIGSMNMDLVVETEKNPLAGETVVGNTFSQIPGGKGANQACAIGRLQGDVGFIGACGRDEYGNILIDSLKTAGVNVNNIERVDDTTGVAFITVEKGGENRIIIIPGANEHVTKALIAEKEDQIKEANIVLLQLEIPLDTVLYSIEMASRYDTTIILDPAPAYKLPDEIYKKLDFILPNEIEIEGLVTDKRFASTEEKVRRLLEVGVGNVILTKGADGVTLYNKSRKKDFFTEKVKAVDTTAAGDAFAGGLAYSLNSNNNIEKAIKYANVVAGLTVTEFGAQSSLPDNKKIKRYLKSLI